MRLNVNEVMLILLCQLNNGTIFTRTTMSTLIWKVINNSRATWWPHRISSTVVDRRSAALRRKRRDDPKDNISPSFLEENFDSNEEKMGSHFQSMQRSILYLLIKHELQNWCGVWLNPLLALCYLITLRGGFQRTRTVIWCWSKFWKYSYLCSASLSS